MPVDFDRLVLGPAMATFGEPIVVRPTESQPGMADYVGVGVFSSRPVDVELDDGGVHSTFSTTLGTRLSSFRVPIVQHDLVQVRGIWYDVFDSNSDGQGGAMLDLRQADPP